MKLEFSVRRCSDLRLRDTWQSLQAAVAGCSNSTDAITVLVPLLPVVCGYDSRYTAQPRISID